MFRLQSRSHEMPLLLAEEAYVGSRKKVTKAAVRGPAHKITAQDKGDRCASAIRPLFENAEIGRPKGRKARSGDRCLRRALCRTNKVNVSHPNRNDATGTCAHGQRLHASPPKTQCLKLCVKKLGITSKRPIQRGYDVLGGGDPGV